ncbi:MAG: YbjQ family protein [Candidatus Methanoperedenaceae archaeon]|nr:YbjQ family protein [Candidatus Methanoperedenaceae archaeon]
MAIQVTNTENFPGMEIVKVLGLVKGNTVRAKWFGKDIIAGLRNLVGGELKEYTEMLTEAREEALNRMISEAEALDADAVVNVRFMTSQVTQGAAELLAYGTAVKTR